jgi:MFS family permease
LKSSSISYGWIVVAGLSITETVSWGIIYYGFPIMLRPMEQELGWSRTALTGAFSVGLGASALAALPVGRWLDRHGPRALMTLGSCLGVALLLVWAHVHTLPALYVCWFGLGLAMAATLYEPAFAAVVSWFHSRHRDRALLTVTLTAGLASTIFMPITSWLLGRMDWRSTLLVLAVVLAVLTIPIHAFVLRQAPKASAPGATTRAATSSATGVTLHEAVRTVVFWVLTAAFVVGNFSTIAVTVHLIPYLADRGYSPTVAALMIGWMGAVQLGGRLLFAPIATRFGYRWVTAVIFLVQGLAVAQLALVSHLPTLVPFVVMLGAANGMATLARATTVAEIFGARHYGSISGAMALGANGARAVGPVGASLLQAGLGGYEAMFWTLTATLTLAALGVMLTGMRGSED